MKSIDRLLELMEILDVSEEDAIKSILTLTAPPPPPATRQNWSRLSTFGNCAPSSKDLWSKLVEADFRCVKCTSQMRLSFNHIDGNAKNHELSNLEVICFSCNRKVSKKATADNSHHYKIVSAAIRIWKETGVFPDFETIRKESGVSQIGGATYLLKFIKSRLEKYNLNL